MLNFLFVQISAAIALIATTIGVLVGLGRRPRSTEPPDVVARQLPAKGTQSLWLSGTFLAIFWPVGIFLIPMYAYHWPPLPDFPYSWVVQVWGVAFGVFGGVLFSRASRTLGKQMTPVIELRRGHQLIQTGPYRFVRHPVYTAIVLIALGQALLFLSLPAAVLTVLLAGLANYRARLEEALLGSAAGFGTMYQSYVARTGRFLPRLRAPR